MTSFIDFLGMTPFILIILGILLIVLQFYVEFESLGTLNKDRKNRQDEIITKYQEQKDKGEISLYGRIALSLELFLNQESFIKLV